jgi:hypothetical protein
MKGLILLTGPAGSGKDTYANHLKFRYGMNIFALADELKEKTAQRYSLSINLFYDRDKKDQKLKSLGKTPRELLIDYSKVLRQEDDLVFCKSVASKFTNGWNVISDMRYTRELNYFTKNYPCTCLYIQRDVKDVGDDIELKAEDFKFVIKNDQTPFKGKYLDSQYPYHEQWEESDYIATITPYVIIVLLGILLIISTLTKK